MWTQVASWWHTSYSVGIAVLSGEKNTMRILRSTESSRKLTHPSGE